MPSKQYHNLLMVAASVGALALASAPAMSAPQTASGWPTYGYSYANTRHVPLTEINPQNVANLVPVWQYQTGQTGSFETSPIVVDGTMYVTAGQNDAVTALDATTGAVKWKYQPKLGFTTFCCGANNRGVALDNGRVFLATLDGRLIALDANTGKPVWDVTIGDPQGGFSETMAPLAWNGIIYIGRQRGWRVRRARRDHRVFPGRWQDAVALVDSLERLGRQLRPRSQRHFAAP